MAPYVYFPHVLDTRADMFDKIRDYYARATNDMFGTPRRKPRATLEDQESPRSAS